MVECPGFDGINFPAIWYRSPEAPQFPICSACYRVHIRGTPLSNHFNGRLEAEDQERRCLFSKEGTLQSWQQASSRHDWDSLRDYVIARSRIPRCQGPSGAKGDSAIKWFRARNDVLPGFIVCEACYWDNIQASPWADRFEPTPMQHPVDQVWSCDLSLPFIRRALKEYAKTNAWDAFVSATKYRMQEPGCTGTTGVPPSSRNWYRPRREIPGLVVCGACYADGIALTPFEPEFQQTPMTIPNDSMWSCDMAVLPIQAAWSTALRDNNFDKWWHATRTVMSSPPCSGNGVENGIWFALSSATSADFAVCPACYAGWVEAQGFGSWFVRRAFPPGTTLQCDFNASSPRFRVWMPKLAEALGTGSFGKFADFVARVSNLPLCTYREPALNRRWYGSDDFYICESCFEEAVRGTSFASRLPLQRQLLGTPGVCDMYSPRMRSLWKAACDKGDLTDFISFAKYRSQVYAETVPQINQLLSIVKMRAQQKMTLMMSATMLNGAGNLISASRPADHAYSTYGNASVGFDHDTYQNAQAAGNFQKANNISLMPGNETMLLTQLEVKWKQVE